MHKIRIMFSIIAISIAGVGCPLPGNSVLTVPNTTPVFSTPKPAKDLPSDQAAFTEIRLEFHPFTESVSKFLRLGSDGKALLIRFDRNRLIVIARLEGKISGESLSRSLEKIRAPSFQETLRQRSFGGKGLSQGDQFYISIETGEKAPENASGFIPDTNVPTQTLLKDLLGLETQLAEAPLADAYVVSKPVEKERFDKSRKAGKSRVAAIDDFPSDLRSIVSAAANRPIDFHALEKEQYKQLLTWSAEDSEFFVTVNNSSYQLTLFKSATGIERKKGDRNE